MGLALMGRDLEEDVSGLNRAYRPEEPPVKSTVVRLRACASC
jgi:hypothetical protein